MHPYIHAQNTPEKLAYVMAGSGETVTYKQLNDRSNQVAQLFRHHGVNRGDAIAIFMENNAHYFEICWAAQRAGVYFTAISSRLTAPEIDYILRDCGAKIIFTSDYVRDVTIALKAIMPELNAAFHVGDALDGFENYRDARDAQPAEPIADESRGLDMLYSSGTTGRPKGIRRALPDGPIEEADSLLGLVMILYGIDENSIYLSPAPLYHAAPLRYNMAAQQVGATCIVMENFEPESALALIEEYKPTHSQWVPTMFVRMLKLPEDVRTKYDLSSMQVAIHAAAPCPIEIKRKMINWWGPVIYEYYAGSEGNGFCAINSEQWLAHEGSVGTPLLGVIHICDDEGNEVPVGEAGTIFFETEGPLFEYYNDDAKTADSRHSNGVWTTLGDVGRLDEDGFLYLTDRKAFMIISGGVNIYPQEAENLLIDHPKVADVAVIGVPNEDFGEEVKAVVQPMDWDQAGDELALELIEYCKQHLSAIKCPRSVDFDKELPRHPTGKLYKRLVRDRYWGKMDSKIV
ncbi:AMP-binding protein [Alphaproteobacteria bacterium]|nr:AMP-binding protein [Alphaproteobacteria bacterium]